MKLFSLLLSLLSVHAVAGEAPAEKFGFACKAAMPTTSFMLEDRGEEMVLKVLHHNGTAYMPIHEGIIVPNDMAYLERKAKTLPLLGTETEFRFPRSRCKTFGEGLISCAGGERRTIGGLDVEALNLVTERNTRQIFDMKFSFTRVVLSLNIAGSPPVQEMSMNYYNDECKFDK
ncbi:MAG: hypothetical protein AB7K68_00950 [Bacteriovoracia bacterium]